MRQSHPPDEHVEQWDEDLAYSTSMRQQTGLSSLRIGNANEDGQNHDPQVDDRESTIASPGVEAGNESVKSKHIVPGAFLNPADDSDEVMSDPILRSQRQEEYPVPEYAKGTSVHTRVSKVN